MNQSQAFYDTSAALALIDPWLRAHLPTLDEAVTRRFIQLVTGIFEQRSLLLENIAESTVFTGTDSSNVTQVRRIIRDARISLETLYYPLLEQLIAELPNEVLYLTMDETSHQTDYCLLQLGLATDGVSLPLGFLIYAPDQAWADDARSVLSTIDDILPHRCRIVLLADRVHTGEPFLACLDELQWYYVFRATESTQIEHPTKGWRPLKRVYKRANTGRYLSNVRIWKQGERRINVSIYKLVRNGFRPTVWYIVSDLPASEERLAEYACRWWQECTFKDCKSNMFEWERGRVTKPERVLVLLMGFGTACWALWLLGRTHEHIPQCKASTIRPQPRRRNILKHGALTFVTRTKRREALVLPKLTAVRVLDYPRFFTAAQAA
jgi:Transposase DDE domain